MPQIVHSDLRDRRLVFDDEDGLHITLGPAEAGLYEQEAGGRTQQVAEMLFLPPPATCLLPYTI